MELKHEATAGTVESSDVLVRVEPGEGRHIELSSSVMDQFGEQIYETINEVLDQLDVQDIKLLAEDQGALDCTIRSRVQTALFRSIDQTENLPWGTLL